MHVDNASFRVGAAAPMARLPAAAARRAGDVRLGKWVAGPADRPQSLSARARLPRGFVEAGWCPEGGIYWCPRTQGRISRGERPLPTPLYGRGIHAAIPCCWGLVASLAGICDA